MFQRFRTNVFLPLLIVVIAVASCKKDEDDPNTNPPPTPTELKPWEKPFTETSEVYFTATINGATIQKEGQSGSGWSLSVGQDSSFATYSASLEDEDANFIADVSIGRLRLSGGYPSETALRNYIKEGSYTFGIPDNTPQSTFNAEVQYQDANGVNWSSYFGAGTQPGSSTLTITDTLHVNIAGTEYVKFKATYNCTLYNLAGTQTMPLTNGVFVGYLSEY